MTIKHPEYHRKAIETYRSLFRPDILELYLHVRSTGDKDLKEATQRQLVACDMYQELHGICAHLKLASKAYQQYQQHLKRIEKRISLLREATIQPCSINSIDTQLYICEMGRLVLRPYPSVRVTKDDINKLRSHTKTKPSAQKSHIEGIIELMKQNMHQEIRQARNNLVVRSRIEYLLNDSDQVPPIIFDGLQNGWITPDELLLADYHLAELMSMGYEDHSTSGRGILDKKGTLRNLFDSSSLLN